jgi:hypothetical protein
MSGGRDFQRRDFWGAGMITIQEHSTSVWKMAENDKVMRDTED